MRLIPLISTLMVMALTINASPLYADTPYKMDPNNPSRTLAAVRSKIEEICHKLNDPRLDSNEKRMDAAKKIIAAFPFRRDKVYVYSRRVKGVVFEVKIRIPFLYKMAVEDEPFRPGGIGTPIKEKAVFLYTIQVDYDVPADSNLNCGPAVPDNKVNGGNTPSLSRTIDKAFATLDRGNPKLVETALFPGIPRIAAIIQYEPPQ